MPAWQVGQRQLTAAVGDGAILPVGKLQRGAVHPNFDFGHGHLAVGVKPEREVGHRRRHRDPHQHCRQEPEPGVSHRAQFVGVPPPELGHCRSIIAPRKAQPKFHALPRDRSKRRVEQDRAETARMASAALVINLLPVFDDLDRAVGTVDAKLAGLNWVQGIIAIEKKFASLLEAMNVTEVPADGQAFDPERHEAVGQQPGAAGKVLYVVQKGYQFGDRVIRPAMVIVGDGSDSSG